MMACVMVRVEYRSHSVSNFHSSLSIAMKNCLIPSRVSSSFLTRMVMGSRMNFCVTSSTSRGIVAEKMVTCTVSGMYLNTSYICSLKPLESISSASSSTNRDTSSSRRARLLIISYTRPGVPTTTCTPSCRARMSSLTAVPPTQAMILMFMKSPSAWMTLTICWASSLVGASTSAWQSLTSLFSFCRMPTAKVAVLPVPD
mmetsp:Transcript_16152/g.35786  ORF Transcript_16152/g.35786 Transcript_16152/m.35786 type:complete len:200 (-) Transcript_16152:412-1011(-)